MKIPAKRIINGSHGSIWVNGEKWMDIESFEAKVTLAWEDQNMAEDMSTHRKLTGYNGEGTATTKKVYSRGAALMAQAVKEGTYPDITIVSKLADPDAFGAERVQLNEVTFNEFTLIKFEQKTVMTEELPFNFATYEPIDLITA